MKRIKKAFKIRRKSKDQIFKKLEIKQLEMKK